MPAKRISIGQVMVVIALAAVNLAIARSAPLEITTYPPIWVVMGSIDFVLIRKLVLRRKFRAFHYTFLIVFVVGFFVMVNLVATERFHPLGLVVRGYQQLSGETRNGVSAGYLEIGEFWLTCVLGLLLGGAAGWIAAWFERHLHWDIAAFLRGALLGLALFIPFEVISEAASGWAQPSRPQLIGRLAVLGIFLIGGGLFGLSKLKSDPAREESDPGQ